MADREDTDPTGAKGRTEPGLGGPTPSSGHGQTAPPSGRANGGPPPAPLADEAVPVDFDALHAALGANEEASGRRLSRPDPDTSESQGRASAQYASTRPHTIPPTRAPNEDPSTPAVIVAETSTTDAGRPPQLVTARLAPHQPASGPQAVAPTASSGPHVAAAPLLDAPPGAFTPSRIARQRQTVVMPQRPRRAQSATIVVRPRGPSTWKKLAAFVVMLMLVTSVGVAVILWRRPEWLGFGPVAIAPTAVRVVPPSTATAPASTSASAAHEKKSPPGPTKLADPGP